MSIIRIEQSNPQFARTNTLTLTVHSSYLGRRQDLTIYGPNSQSKNLPVVILLHGVYGNNWVWMDLGGAHVVYEQLRKQGLDEFVLLMPSDGGIWDGSAYLPLQDQGDFERWIMEDAIQALSTTVDSVSSASNLYICGLSMGGYGALRLGSKYAQKIRGISAHSAITQISDIAHFTETPLQQYQTLNEQETDIVYWCKKHRDQLPPIRFDCGNNDPLLSSNEDLSTRLKVAKIAHEFNVYEGGHEWSYWHKHVAKSLWFFNEIESKISI